LLATSSHPAASTAPPHGNISDAITAAASPDSQITDQGRGLITPAALQRMVDARAAHPRRIRPGVECVARTVYREAANQALQGQLAVAQVIVNRTKSLVYPKSACAVIRQPGQFSHMTVDSSGTTTKTWRTAVAIATIATEHHVADVAPGALYFHESHIRPAWSHRHERISQIGDHIFYR
jgi:N-acetylmuramoyl-L-alanine amidase